MKRLGIVLAIALLSSGALAQFSGSSVPAVPGSSKIGLSEVVSRMPDANETEQNTGDSRAVNDDDDVGVSGSQDQNSAPRSNTASNEGDIRLVLAIINLLAEDWKNGAVCDRLCVGLLNGFMRTNNNGTQAVAELNPELFVRVVQSSAALRQRLIDDRIWQEGLEFLVRNNPGAFVDILGNWNYDAEGIEALSAMLIAVAIGNIESLIPTPRNPENNCNVAGRYTRAFIRLLQNKEVVKAVEPYFLDMLEILLSRNQAAALEILIATVRMGRPFLLGTNINWETGLERLIEKRHSLVIKILQYWDYDNADKEIVELRTTLIAAACKRKYLLIGGKGKLCLMESAPRVLMNLIKKYEALAEAILSEFKPSLIDCRVHSRKSFEAILSWYSWYTDAREREDLQDQKSGSSFRKIIDIIAEVVKESTLS